MFPNRIKGSINHFYFLVTIITVWFAVIISISNYSNQLCSPQDSFHKALHYYKFVIFISNELFDFLMANFPKGHEIMPLPSFTSFFENSYRPLLSSTYLYLKSSLKIVLQISLKLGPHFWETDKKAWIH